jgi:uncharacterized membrane protein
MATLTVLKFPTPDGAEKAVEKLLDLQQQQLIKVEDAAIVSWEPGKKKPKTRQAIPTTGLGALDGAFWGMLFGLIFFVPILGMAVGALSGAISGSFADYGIDDAFIKKVRDQITPGTSALFSMTSNAVADRVAEAFKGDQFEIIATNLSQEQETKLKEAFHQS